MAWKSYRELQRIKFVIAANMSHGNTYRRLFISIWIWTFPRFIHFIQPIELQLIKATGTIQGDRVSGCNRKCGVLECVKIELTYFAFACVFLTYVKGIGMQEANKLNKPNVILINIQGSINILTLTIFEVIDAFCCLAQLKKSHEEYNLHFLNLLILTTHIRKW